MQYNCRREEELANLSIDVTESIHYKNARQFGVNIEQYVRKAKFNAGCRLMADCSGHEDLKRAKMYFEETADIENSPEKLMLCEEKIAQANELTNDLRRVYGSFDPDCDTENNETLINVREMKKKIETTYPKFVGGEIKEPWSPAPVAVWFIPLGIGLLVFAFFALFKPMAFSEEYMVANNDYSVMIACAAPVLSIIAGYIGFAKVRNSFSLFKLILIIVVGSSLSSFVTSFFKWQSDKDLTDSLQTIGGAFFTVGLLLLGISALLIVLYLKKAGFIRRFRKDSETLEKLAGAMKSKREEAVLAELAKHPDFKQSFLDECVEEAVSTYKNSLSNVS